MNEKTMKQPVSQVVWLHRDRLFANDYNPNNVFRPEMRLLKLSLLEDGWTLPLIIKESEGDKFEIIDGFHRWTLSGTPEVYAMTDGLVPCVQLKIQDKTRQMMSTIRYNRARGVHHIVKMADIVNYMAESNLTQDEVMKELGMEKEEFTRLLEKGNMKKRGSAAEFGKGMKPTLQEGVGIQSSK